MKRDQKFQMDALFQPNDQYRDRITVRAGFVAHAGTSAKDELYVVVTRKVFPRCATA